MAPTSLFCCLTQEFSGFLTVDKVMCYKCRSSCRYEMIESYLLLDKKPEFLC